VLKIEVTVFLHSNNTSKNIVVFLQFLYFPDLTPCDIFLLLKVTNHL